MHPEARAFVVECAAAVKRSQIAARLHISEWLGDGEPPEDENAYGTVIEYGSRNINGTVRDLFPNTAYTGVDIAAGTGVDVIANAAVWRPHTLANVVVCCEVLEHTNQARRITRNACRSIVVGGHVIITCATDPREPHSGVDGGPVREGEYYENVVPEEFTSWIQELNSPPRGVGGYSMLRTKVTDDGDLYALIQRII